MMTIEQKYKMFKKLLSTVLPEKFYEVERVEVKDVSESYTLKNGLFDVTIYVDGTEQEQEEEIDDYINELLGHTGEVFNYRIKWINTA
jgi:hypothetical protein